jgi:hypothetical protein
MDAFIDLFDPLPVAVLFGIFIAAGLAFIFRARGTGTPLAAVGDSGACEHQYLGDDPGAGRVLFGADRVRDRRGAESDQ